MAASGSEELSASTDATFVGGEVAPDGSIADGGLSESEWVGDTISVTQPLARKDFCDPSTSTKLTNLENKLEADFKDTDINDTDHATPWKVTANKSTEFTWNISGSVTGQVKAAIFGKVETTINAGIERKSSTTYGSEKSLVTKARSKQYINRGKLQELVGVTETRIDRQCKKTTKTGTFKAPYRDAWHYWYA